MAFAKLEKDGAVAIITINRPEALNALNADVIKDLGECVKSVALDKSLRALIITGEGRSFVAGADIAAMQPLNPSEGRDFGRNGAFVFRALESLEIPTIAAVNGFALGGGCELALSCDIILASEKAKFGQPEVGLGITPGFSGTQRLPRRIGIARAKELIFSAKVISAEEAKAIGLCEYVYPETELMDEAKKMALSFAGNAPVAVKYAKACIDRGMQTDIDSGIAVENELFALCFATEDQKEGMSAFLEKRKAEFKGQ